MMFEIDSIMYHIIMIMIRALGAKNCIIEIVTHLKLYFTKEIHNFQASE